MGAIATLTLDIIGRSDKLRAELVKSAKFTQSWAQKNRAALNASAKTIATTSVASGAAATAAFTAIYTSAAQSADAIAKTSDKLGINAEKLQALHHAGELTGVSTGKMDMALQRMTRRVGEAAQGTGEAVKAIQELGLSASDLAAMSPDQQMAAIADAMKNVESQGDRVRLAFKLFDSEGVGLVNTLAMGSEGLNAMSAEVNALGMALNRVELAKIESANDAFYRAKEVTGGFGKVLTAEVAPIVKAISDAFVDSAKEAGGFGVIAKRIVNATVTGFGHVADVVHGLKVTFYVLKQAVYEVFNAILNNIAAQAGVIADFKEALGMDASHLRGIQQYSAGFNKEVKSMRAELHALAMEEMPSASIKRFVKNAQQAADEAAREVAAKSKANIGAVYSAGDSVGKPTEKTANESIGLEKLAAENAQIIRLHQEKYQAIQAAALEAQNNQTALEEMRRQKELADFEAEHQQLIERNLMTSEIKQQFRDMETLAEQTHQNRLAQIKREQEEKSAAYRRQIWAMGLNAAAGTMGELMTLMEQNGKKQGKMYKSMFAVQKAASIASMIVSTLEAANKARASAPNPAIGETLASISMASGMVNVGIAAGTAIAGIAHGGLDYVPSESTFLLDKGERVLSPRQNSDLTNFLSSQSSPATAPTTNNHIKIEFIVNESNDEDFMAKIMQNRSQITNVISSVLGQTGKGF